MATKAMMTAKKKVKTRRRRRGAALQVGAHPKREMRENGERPSPSLFFHVAPSSRGSEEPFGGEGVELGAGVNVARLAVEHYVSLLEVVSTPAPPTRGQDKGGHSNDSEGSNEQRMYTSGGNNAETNTGVLTSSTDARKRKSAFAGSSGGGVLLSTTKESGTRHHFQDADFVKALIATVLTNACPRCPFLVCLADTFSLQLPTTTTVTLLVLATRDVAAATTDTTANSNSATGASADTGDAFSALKAAEMLKSWPRGRVLLAAADPDILLP
eukprot:CAMPEP_0171850108 /NCGR_PEP_ID=MMETSP0992-20121227/20100_1 /TAXON_ID=483369 /ORGANISM="non described non described, Strain CCMP2098" /LENGTH=270 /DNA_ID=CAMNT_0012469495 /DNA_START=19 /DNA_END=833 /DNA_ORIENTATION=+